jgi:hypothetical protein
MNKIKIAGAFVFFISITLTILFNYTSKINQNHNVFIEKINLQKSFTQEISKNIFYLFKNKTKSTKILKMDVKLQTKNKNIISLWNKFYLDVQTFKKINTINSMYSTIILQKIVNNIYLTNLNLIKEFDILIKVTSQNYSKKMLMYRYIQYILYFTLVLLLLYLFTQVKLVIEFVQKFLFTSKLIIQDSSIKNLEPINLTNNSNEVLEATQNFNKLVKKIDESILYSTESIQNSCNSMELLDSDIEKLIELIYTMNNKNIDSELNKKEDVIIHTLEELNKSKNKLLNLHSQLQNLIK